MKSFLSAVVLILLSVSCSNVNDSPVTESFLKIYSENRWYWEYEDKPVLLLGGSAEDNLFQYPNDYYDDSAESLEEHLDTLVAAGGNYVRNTMSSRNPGNLFPYMKITGTPGINNSDDVYDLDQWDDEYWKRFGEFLKLSADRDIIVQLEIFDRFDLHQAESLQENSEIRGIVNTGWEAHPWNPDRNINYTSESSGLRGGTIDDMKDDNELYYSVPALSMNAKAPEPIVLETLQKYVDRLLSIAFMYNNILYVIENESYQPVEFGDYWVDYIQEKADEAGKTIYVTNMRGNPEPESEDQQLILKNNKYTFFDYSQNNHNEGQEHYDNFIKLREEISGKPKPINSVKIYGGIRENDEIEEGKRRMWRAIFSGVAAVRFHRQGNRENAFGIGLNNEARRWIRSARIFTDSMNIFSCEPGNDLLGNRESDEAYCLAEPGNQYAVYFTNGGEVTLDLSGQYGVFNLRWMDISTSEWGESKVISGGNHWELKTPSSGQWAALITR